mmetsp:Transcript_58173/g.147559  ORF Transcript_58173/g.147559 Transcript_58173/m.147559 type:complete len:160 (-) Transcript_58173:31-510(-)
MSRKYRERLALSSGIGSSRAFESDFGKRILMKYGWEEGQGLGRKRDGRVECIQATRREEKKGLGAEKRKAEDQWDNWWSDCFNNIAKRLSSKESLDGSTTASKSSSAGDDSDSSSDSESEAGVKAKDMDGGRITAVKRAGAMAGKLRRVQRQEKPAVRV